MINLLHAFGNNGPGKVVLNLKKGLDLIGVEYKENAPINHDDFVVCLQWSDKALETNCENLIIGPNICTLPIDNNFMMSKKYKKTIVPCEWVKKKYSRWLPENLINIWPVGIDTDLFCDLSKEEKTKDCLVYFKRRKESELKKVCDFLNIKKQSFDIIKYGSYSENELINCAKKSKYVFVINNTESQGIAIEELMSCNLPLLVWDVDNWSDRGEEYKVPATSIPYWSTKCGESFINENEMENKFDIFIKNLYFYTPRDYVLENLTLEKQAKELIENFNKVYDTSI